MKNLQGKVVGGGGGRGGGAWDGGGYCWLGIFVEVDVGREVVVVDDAVASCCCFAVSSTGIGSVKASSTLGNGPRGLLSKRIVKNMCVV